MEKVKFMAYYLPAFHEIEENNKWYGKGFTEWDNTRNAKVLFNNHYQPRIPWKYYDLLDDNIVIEQMKMAKDYNVDGFIYYHYWFNEEGYKILEKPAERLIKIPPDQRIDFCFAWANETWRKTWNDKPGEAQLLIKQEYGEEKDWNAHFDYLLQFFKDEKYVKVDNCPMLLIYRPENIPNYSKMIVHLNNRAKDCGFNGIHIVRMMTNRRAYNNQLSCDACVDFEPNLTLNCSVKENFVLWRIKNAIFWKLSKYDWFVSRYLNTIDYDSFYNTLEKRFRYSNSKKYIGLFSDWDNSPRKGKRGTIFVNSSPEKFEKHLRNAKKICVDNHCPFIFCFAWNEWGEGGHLEPDLKYKKAYLEAIKTVMGEKNETL